jgi:SAM-dependent methyltransferase
MNHTCLTGKVTAVLWLSLLLFISCKQSGSQDVPPGDGDTLAVQSDDRLRSIERIIATQNPVDRFAWQKPHLILDLLGDIKEKKIADVGAGYGFFTLLIPFREAEVIAIDIDTSALNWITTTAEKLPEHIRARIEIRHSVPDDPLLEEEEIDAAIIVNTIGYIPNRSTYLGLLQKAIRPGGKLLIVDYKTKRIPMIIPDAYKLHLRDVEDLLYEAGYENIVTDDCLLEYQYVIRATVPGPDL